MLTLARASEIIPQALGYVECTGTVHAKIQRVSSAATQIGLTLLGLPKSLPVAYTVKAKMQRAT